MEVPKGNTDYMSILVNIFTMQTARKNFVRVRNSDTVLTLLLLG